MIESRVGVVTGEVTAVHEAFCSVSLGVDPPKIQRGSHITFSMENWQGKRTPLCGQVVILEELTLFKKGWRALSAKPIQT